MLNKLSFNLMNELNESETKAIQIKKKVFMEGSDVRVEELKEEKNYVLTEDASSALDNIISGDEVYFRDPDGVAMVVRYSENYQNPEDYDEGYKSEYGGDPEELEAAKQAAEEGNVWEFVGVDDDGTETGTVYNIVYGQEELRRMLEDLREVKMIKKLEDGQIEDAKADSIEKGLYSEGEEICKECNKPLAECNCKKDKVEEAAPVDTSKEDRLASLKTQLEKDGDQLADDEKAAIEDEIANLEKELQEGCDKSLKEDDYEMARPWSTALIQHCENYGADIVWEETLKSLVKFLPDDRIKEFCKSEFQVLSPEEIDSEDEIEEGCNKSLKEDYSERLGGDPEDFISDMKSLLYQLRTIEVENFGTYLAKQIVYDFEETVENQMKMIANKYDLEESEKNKLNEAVFEVDVAFEDINDYHNEEEVIAAVKDWLGDLANKVKIELESFEGPGAGWPIVRLTGDKEKIGEFLNKNYNSGDDTLEDTIDMYMIKESKKVENKPIVEAAETEVKDLQVIKEQGNVYMLEDKSEGTRYIVGENYNLSEGEIENAEIYENKEEADKDYLDRCEVIKDGEEFNSEEDTETVKK